MCCKFEALTCRDGVLSSSLTCCKAIITYHDDPVEVLVLCWNDASPKKLGQWV